MKFKYLASILALAILNGWWLNSRRDEVRPVRRPTVVQHVNIAAMTEVRKPAAIGQVEEVRRNPRSVREFAEELQRLKACESSGQCAYPQTDPRSYGFALAQDVKKILFRMAEWVRSESLESREVSEIAREFLQSEDGFVQASALDLIATQPTSIENRDAILRQVIEGHDSNLIEHAMLELERYTGSSDRDVIDQVLGRVLTTGAPFVARAVSNFIGPFVDARSYRFFTDVLAQLPPDSIYYEKLEASLKAFSEG